MEGRKVGLPLNSFIFRALDEELGHFIQGKRVEMAASKTNIKRRNILELALEDEDYGSQASIQELIDQIKTFLFAGHDTSASMVAWTYYYLSRYPDQLAKVREEHNVVLGANSNPAYVAQLLSESPHLLQKLEYTMAVMREILRLQPMGDGARQAPERYLIRTATGKELDAGDTMLCIQHQALHTAEDIWGADALKFIPERFMQMSSIPEVFMPFSKRPRDCIGRTFAFLEVHS